VVERQEEASVQAFTFTYMAFAFFTAISKRDRATGRTRVGDFKQALTATNEEDYQPYRDLH